MSDEKLAENSDQPVYALKKKNKGFNLGIFLGTPR